MTKEDCSYRDSSEDKKLKVIGENNLGQGKMTKILWGVLKRIHATIVVAFL